MIYQKRLIWFSKINMKTLDVASYVIRSMLQKLWLVNNLPLDSKEPIPTDLLSSLHLRLLNSSHDPFYCRPYLTVGREPSIFFSVQRLTYCFFWGFWSAVKHLILNFFLIKKTVKMSDTKEPVYAPFFGVMGAASAIIFSGKFLLMSKLSI